MNCRAIKCIHNDIGWCNKAELDLFGVCENYQEESPIKPDPLDRDYWEKDNEWD